MTYTFLSKEFLNRLQLRSNIVFSNIKDFSKTFFQKTVRKGDMISVVFSEIENEEVIIKEFTGFCKRLKSKKLNTKLIIFNLIHNSFVELNFFLYGATLIDVGFIKKKNKKKKLWKLEQKR